VTKGQTADVTIRIVARWTEIWVRDKSTTTTGCGREVTPVSWNDKMR
jgi:hypothetical protein